jgi:hypothetical protein
MGRFSYNTVDTLLMPVACDQRDAGGNETAAEHAERRKDRPAAGERVL